MTRKKFLSVFVVLIAMFMGLEIRLFFLMNGSVYTEAAAMQGTYTKSISANRPDFYDRNGLAITGTAVRELAIVDPNDYSSYDILNYISDADTEQFYEQIKNGRPFTVPLDRPIPRNVPIDIFSVRSRYEDNGVAKHLIGYTNYENHGVSGLEYALDDYLYGNITETMMTIDVNARGRAIDGSSPMFYEQDNNNARVTLTLDREMQTAAEEVANEAFERGAIVILDAATFDVLAMVSRPDFLQNDVAAALEYDDGALLNRTLGAYNIGSVYKLIIAAAALEAGVPEDFSYTCSGEIEVNGQRYTCNNSKAHGEVDLQGALTVSCNSYFIALGQYVGSEAIYNMAKSMGLGRPVSMLDSYSTATGYMPSIAQLNSNGELCNNSFGQGLLLASPLHVAAYTACIASGGIMRNVSIVQQIGDENIISRTEKRAMSPETAAIIARGMVGVVEDGTGMRGKPTFVTAAGKTGTAETGFYNENGTEKVNGWFTGWYPADNPQYIITIMTENAGSSSEGAAPAFRLLVDMLYSRGL